MNKFGLTAQSPPSVVRLLQKGMDGEVPDTPKRADRIFEKVQNIIIGSNGIAVEAAKDEALALGLVPEVISTTLSGEAGEVGRWLAGKAREDLSRRLHGVDVPNCLISGGETTVHVRGKGKGGRNTELALSFAMEIDGIEGITMLSAGTDGTDGPTDAAGAIIDGTTIAKARELGLDPQKYLDNNDSYTFFKRTDSLLITGPTGTNVMDVQIVIIHPSLP
jgi:glycerate 2-kinase